METQIIRIAKTGNQCKYHFASMQTCRYSWHANTYTRAPYRESWPVHILYNIHSKPHTQKRGTYTCKYSTLGAHTVNHGQRPARDTASLRPRHQTPQRLEQLLRTHARRTLREWACVAMPMMQLNDRLNGRYKRSKCKTKMEEKIMD